MAIKTTISVKQGARVEVPFQVSDDETQDFSTWTAWLTVVRKLVDPNSGEQPDVLVDEEVQLNAQGVGVISFSNEDTSKFPVGDYVYGIAVSDNAGGVGHSDTAEFTVEAVAKPGIIA